MTLPKKKKTRRRTRPAGRAVAFRMPPDLISDVNAWAQQYRLSRNKLVDLVLRHVVDGRSTEDLYQALEVFRQDSVADEQANLFA